MTDAIEIVRRVLQEKKLKGISLERSEYARIAWEYLGLTLRQRDEAIAILINTGEAMLVAFTNHMLVVLRAILEAPTAPLP
jgi:hypothetical protein